MELDAGCLGKFQEAIEAGGGRAYAGSQADEVLLKQVVADAAAEGDGRGLYDVIVDDGGHNPTMQLQTLAGLWPALKSGGVYIVEDVQTTYLDPAKYPMYVLTGPGIMEAMARMVQLVHCHSNDREGLYTEAAKAACGNATAVEQQLLSVECMVEACVLVKL
jgi:hypothetical protein